jgi:putative transposase
MVRSNNKHAPPHLLFEPGIYMVTAGTYQKLPHWNTPQRLDYLLAALFECAAEFGWQLQAWAVLANHYHFVATSPLDPASLRKFLSKLHMTTAKQLNQWDGAPGRKVWYQFWDSQITFENAYLARLNYVNHNPSHHGVVEDAINYRWCSASWFAENTSASLRGKVASCKVDKSGISDEF